MEDAHRASMSERKCKALKEIATKLRIHSIESTNTAGSGHPTSCCSIAEILSVLFFHTMRYKVTVPKDLSSDRFVLSKGHAAPILYAAWAEAGLFPVSDLANLRKIDSDLEGHPTPRLSFVDFATGSLGQGLSCACGMAYMGKYIDKASYRVFCLVGDAESAEGSIWEAMNFASHYKLDNLCAIFDINRLGQSGPTMFQHDLNYYKNRTEAFGDLWDHFSIRALFFLPHKGVENLENFHGKALAGKGRDAVVKLKETLSNDPSLKNVLEHRPVQNDVESVELSVKLTELPHYSLGDKVAVRQAYANALVKLGKTCERLLALDGDMKNSTYSQEYGKVFPDRHIECFVAEQNMVGVALGCAARGRAIAFSSTFACFFSRAFDQIRMAAVSQAAINFCGSHPGVSIGVDGPSQMALEDIAMFRSIPNCVVFYPSDAVSCERAVELAANYEYMTFIRSTRGTTPVIYQNDEIFEIGKAKAENDSALVIGAGVTLAEAMKAADLLKEHKISIRILDPFTVKPIDSEAIIKHAKACNGKVLTVEDHYLEGGLGEAVLAAVAQESGVTVRTLAVTEVPRSGPGDELLEMFGISANHIVKAVRELNE
ncbi:PREDICTED: transketolase-like protein 2 [Acropora digitifera]|uniref:transketolase-like protein 2 n=1 Tax=Acropora digitifera TaxID=70779 RepID=UPI00077ADCCC|nr:PREDICTED: transketolase-like protein 2 [Acropora digitifera]